MLKIRMQGKLLESVLDVHKSQITESYRILNTNSLKLCVMKLLGRILLWTPYSQKGMTSTTSKIVLHGAILAEF